MNNSRECIKPNEIKHSHESVALVIDSIADIDLKLLPSFVFMLPVSLVYNGKIYQDKVTASKDLVRRKGVTTSQPNPYEIKQFLSPIVKRFKEVLVLTVSSKMSGIYNGFSLLTQLEEGYENVQIIDTKKNSAAEGLLVFKAVEMIKSGLPLSELSKKIEMLIPKCQILVSMDNLKAVINSGRLTVGVGKTLDVIKVKPIIGIDNEGSGVLKAVTFSRKQSENKLLDKLKEVKGVLEHYVIVHSADIERVKKFAKRCETIVGKAPLYIEDISIAVLLHAGFDSIAIGYITK